VTNTWGVTLLKFESTQFKFQIYITNNIHSTKHGPVTTASFFVLQP